MWKDAASAHPSHLFFSSQMITLNSIYGFLQGRNPEISDVFSPNHTSSDFIRSLTAALTASTGRIRERPNVIFANYTFISYTYLLSSFLAQVYDNYRRTHTAASSPNLSTQHSVQRSKRTLHAAQRMRNFVKWLISTRRGEFCRQSSTIAARCYTETLCRARERDFYFWLFTAVQESVEKDELWLKFLSIGWDNISI